MICVFSIVSGKKPIVNTMRRFLLSGALQQLFTRCKAEDLCRKIFAAAFLLMIFEKNLLFFIDKAAITLYNS